MARFSLGCYTVRVIDKNTEENLSLGNLPRNLDLITVFNNYLQDRTVDHSTDEKSQKLLRVLSCNTRDCSVNGIVETGEYGYTADLIDVNTETVSYRRRGTDAEMMPFYFLAHLPSHLDEGVILLQRRSNIGIRTVFLEDFARYFEESSQGVKVVVNPLVPQQLIDEYLKNGRLTKMRFIRYSLPTDLADAYDKGGHVENEGTAEIVFMPRRGQGLPFLEKIGEAIAGNLEIKEIYELTDYEYENVKVEIDVRGSKKTLDLSDVMKMRAYVDITSDVRLNIDGHPDFNSIDNIAQDLLSSLLADLGTGSRDV